MNYLKKIVIQTRLFRTSALCLNKNECKKYEVVTSQEKGSGKTPRVVVVGAGMAGLSAAARLFDAGYNDILVLEATERPGGRIYSCWFGNSVAEVGAQWITGHSLSNSVVPLARQEGLLDDASYEYDYSTGMYMTSNGRPVDQSISANAYLVFNQVVKQAYALSALGKCNNGSLMDFFSVRIEQELQSFPVHQREDAAAIMYGLTNKISNRWGADLNNVSADLFGTFVPLVGKSIGLPIGFINVLSPLIKTLPKDTIRYQKVVKQIQWQGSKRPDVRVLVKCADHCDFYADYVIVTVSLGVLKELGCMLFDPKLPDEKLDAIKSIGFGNISKIFLEYKTPFWMPKQGPIKFAWSAKELNNRDSWMNGLHCLEELPGCSYALMAVVSGCYADEVEELRDLHVAEQITYMLRKFTQNSTIPFPDSVLRSRWKSSPYFFGSSSYMHVNSSPTAHNELMKSVPSSSDGNQIPKIFFAGEAMSKDSFSTVHGARLSGLKTAEEIIQLTKKFNGPPPIKDPPSQE